MTSALAAFILALISMHQSSSGIVTIAQGTRSAMDDPKETVARMASEWQTLWREHAGSEPAPAVDFAKEMVAAVFLGTRPTGGYGVDIVAARREGAALIVEYRERRPPPGALASQALTSPFHIVRIARHDGTVTFRAAPPDGGR